MNKFSKIAAMMFCMAVAANAQLKGLGYDGDLRQITGRLGLGANFLDVGVGLKFDNSDGVADDAKFQMSGSAFYLGHLHDWGAFDNYFTAGLVFAKLPQADDNLSLSAFVGLQPEVTLLDHIVLSTRFGLDIPIMPAFILQTAGSQISIVNGANFKVLF
ncbi:MAG: hypothetical protein M3Y08_11490 [Fibrobacterota bacterium]|nr:hypothetical protein [Fibrobacterota bacterium]